MNAEVFIHPAPQLARLNQHLLKISIGLCIITLGFSLSTLGQFSLWITPATFILSMAHNITLLVLSSKERKGKRPLTGGKLPATATKASYICAFVLAFLWCGAIATLLVFCINFVLGFGDDGGYFTIVPWFEWIFALFDVVVLITFGVVNIKERRAVLGLQNSPKWWNKLRVVKNQGDGSGQSI